MVVLSGITLYILQTVGGFSTGCPDCNTVTASPRVSDVSEVMNR